MAPRRDYIELLRVIGICIGGSLALGLAIAVFKRPPMPFGVAVMGYTLLLGSGLVAVPLGENLDLERRRGQKRWDMVLLLAICTTMLVVVGFLAGLQTPPLIGQSENHILFPALVAVGFFGGALSNQARFRRD